MRDDALPLLNFTLRHNTKPLLYITSLNDTTPLPDHTKRCITIAKLYFTPSYFTPSYFTPSYFYTSLPYYGNIIFLVHILLYTKSTSTTILLSKQYSFYLTYYLYYCKSTYLSSYTRYILQ